ncbi:YqaA family protein [Thiosocius teredinicola]|uniref:YqaA family protein n=1 Tax=Thiosocius teredinicola TaxID=1973002 RepID=UPI0009911FBE
MKIFSSLYAKAMVWARHPHAPWYLGGLSFAESSFFPIPPDVMLAPMSLAQPKRAVWFATLATLTSVAGGIFGYLIGMFAFELVQSLLTEGRYAEPFALAKQWFEEWGFVAIFAAGFSPIPYKVFTITAGVLSMAFLPFVLASFIGRGMRFYLVSLLMAWGGESMEAKLHRWVDWLGWLTVAAIVIIVLVYRY